MSEFSSSMNGKLRPVVAADYIWIRPVVQKKFYAALMTLLRGDQQWRGQICCLGVHIGT